MAKDSVKKELKTVLADTYALYLKTQNYHWNVTGVNFYPFHKLFEEMYGELAEAIDTLAERIRALGDKAPGTFSAFSSLTSIKEDNSNLSAEAMVKDLANDQSLIVKIIGKALKAAQEEGDEATADMLIGRIEHHDKNAWMLDSTLKK